MKSLETRAKELSSVVSQIFKEPGKINPQWQEILKSTYGCSPAEFCYAYHQLLRWSAKGSKDAKTQKWASDFLRVMRIAEGKEDPSHLSDLMRATVEGIKTVLGYDSKDYLVFINSIKIMAMDNFKEFSLLLAACLDSKYPNSQKFQDLNEFFRVTPKAVLEHANPKLNQINFFAALEKWPGLEKDLENWLQQDLMSHHADNNNGFPGVHFESRDVLCALAHILWGFQEGTLDREILVKLGTALVGFIKSPPSNPDDFDPAEGLTDAELLAIANTIPELVPNFEASLVRAAGMSSLTHEGVEKVLMKEQGQYFFNNQTERFGQTRKLLQRVFLSNLIKNPGQPYGLNFILATDVLFASTLDFLAPGKSHEQALLNKISNLGNASGAQEKQRATETVLFGTKIFQELKNIDLQRRGSFVYSTTTTASSASAEWPGIFSYKETNKAWGEIRSATVETAPISPSEIMGNHDASRDHPKIRGLNLNY